MKKTTPSSRAHELAAHQAAGRFREEQAAEARAYRLKQAEALIEWFSLSKANPSVSIPLPKIDR